MPKNDGPSMPLRSRFSAHVGRHAGERMVGAANAGHDRAQRRPLGDAAVVDLAIVVAGHDVSACRRRGRYCCGRTSGRRPSGRPSRRSWETCRQASRPAAWWPLRRSCCDTRPGPACCGSNVSTCVGPPASHTQTTEVSLTGLPALLRRGPSGQQFRQRQRAGSQRADLEKVAASRTVAVSTQAVRDDVRAWLSVLRGLIRPPRIDRQPLICSAV